MPRYLLTVPEAVWQRLAAMDEADRDRLLAVALAKVDPPLPRGRVAVCAPDGAPLAPCHAARARALVASGRAVLLRRRPPLIALRQRVSP
jgi:hypothetical protein